MKELIPYLATPQFIAPFLNKSFFALVEKTGQEGEQEPRERDGRCQISPISISRF